MKIILVVNHVSACIRTSDEDDNFPREGGGCVYLMLLRIFRFWFIRRRKNLFQLILGLLGISIRSILYWFIRLRDRGCMSKECVCVCVSWLWITEICEIQFFVVSWCIRLNNSFNFSLWWIKCIVIAIVIVLLLSVASGGSAWKKECQL